MDEIDIAPVEKPAQFGSTQFRVGLELVEVDHLIRASAARATFDVSGKGLTVAVCDTGINSEHVDFENRILQQVNYTSENDGVVDDATDGHGHGTNVTGIIAANHDHIGVAPEASIVPIKVLDNVGNGSFSEVERALDWVLNNHQIHNISVVCMSLGSLQNFQTDETMTGSSIQQLIQQLRDVNVAVVIAAGNHFYRHNSREGMGFPAIVRDCISVGAVYDETGGKMGYGNGAVAHSTGPDRVTPFSQRLHDTTHPFCYTNIFAPGAPVTSSGIQGPYGESTQEGTSQAAPVVCGVILLAQEFYKRVTGRMPEVADILRWMRDSAVQIHDGDDEDDNVVNTQKEYLRLDAVRMLSHIKRAFEIEALIKVNNLQQVDTTTRR